MSMKKRRLRLTHGFGWGTGRAAEAACLFASRRGLFLRSIVMSMKKRRLRSIHGCNWGAGHAAEAAYSS